MKTPPCFISGLRRGNPALLSVFPVLLLLLTDAVRARSAPGALPLTPNGAVRAVVLQPDGAVVIGGDFTALSLRGGAEISRNRIARLNADGSLDSAFNPDAGGPVHALALQADGGILAGGDFTTIGGLARGCLARLDAVSGAADSSFNPGADRNVTCLAVQADGRILAGGYFSAIGGQERRFIARLDPVTGAADSFNPGASRPVYALAVQPDGKIIAGGIFSRIGGQTRWCLARLDPVSGLADSFDPAANHPVYALAVQADGKILAGGSFIAIGGQPRHRIARLDPVSGAADSFDPKAGDEVRALAVQPDGKVLIGGRFTLLAPNGGAAVPRGRLARLNPDGSVETAFNPDAAGGDVLCMALQPGGGTIAGGSFTSVRPGGGAASASFARLAWLGRDGTPVPAAASPPRILAVERGAGGKSLQITFEAAAGESYRLERSLSLSGSAWEAPPGAIDLTTAAKGPARLTDPGPLPPGRAFYRVRRLP